MPDPQLALRGIASGCENATSTCGSMSFRQNGMRISAAGLIQ
jgi:hypothetical protein